MGHSPSPPFAQRGHDRLLPVRARKSLALGRSLLIGLNSEPELETTLCSCSWSSWAESEFLSSCWASSNKPRRPGDSDLSPGTGQGSWMRGLEAHSLLRVFRQMYGVLCFYLRPRLSHAGRNRTCLVGVCECSQQRMK